MKKLHSIEKCSLVKRIKPRNEVITRTRISFTFLLFVLKYGDDDDDNDKNDSNNDDDIGNYFQKRLEKEKRWKILITRFM